MTLEDDRATRAPKLCTRLPSTSHFLIYGQFMAPRPEFKKLPVDLNIYILGAIAVENDGELITHIGRWNAFRRSQVSSGIP